MEVISLVFTIIEVILIPAYVALYVKCERNAQMVSEAKEVATRESNNLRAEMLKDFATKQELTNSVQAFAASVQKLENKIDKLSDSLITYFKKGIE